MTILRYAFFLMIGLVAGHAYSQQSQLLESDFDLKSKGVLLQVTADVPVFSRPDPNSARLANAESGTVLLVIELSSKKSWVHIEDDQGTRGWVPVDRTDLRELLEAQVKIQNAQLEAAKAQLEESAEAQKEAQAVESQASVYQSNARISHVIGPLYEFNGGRGWGALYSLLFDFQIPEQGIVRQRSFGAELAWLNLKPEHRYDLRVRYSSRFSWDGRFTYGPDVSVRLPTARSSAMYILAYRFGYELLWRFPLEMRVAISSERTHRWLSELSWRIRF